MADSINLDVDDGDELELEPEPDEPPARPRRGRPPGRSKRSGTASRSGKRRPPQETRIRESLEAIGGWLHDRGDEELGGTLERDAPKMAHVLGDVANVNPAAKRVVTVLADVLEPVRAFGPTLRILWRRVLDWRASRLAELAAEPGEEELYGAAVVQPAPASEPELAEPWRIAPG